MNESQFRRLVAWALAAALCACHASGDGAAPIAADSVAAKAAIDSFPMVRGRLSVVQRIWHRGDTAMVQLMAVHNPLVPASSAESTLIVWVTPERRVARTMWALELDPSRSVRSNER